MSNTADISIPDTDLSYTNSSSSNEPSRYNASALASNFSRNSNVLELKHQNLKLQKHLAISREDLNDMAADARRLLREIVDLQTQRAMVTVDRDAWRTQAERMSIPLSLRTWRQRRAR